MKPIRSAALLLILFLLSAGTIAIAKRTISDYQSEIASVLKTQCDAWNLGDIDTFMKGYVDSPDTSYVSAGSEVYGYQALKKRYQDKYGDSAASMGKLQFSDLKTVALGKDNALCIGHWHLERSSQPTLNGTFSLVFQHTAGGWKILHDHTSSN